jgi:hypothetical protein
MQSTTQTTSYQTGFFKYNCGTNLLSLYLSNGLRIENTFFTALNHYTFTNINNGEQTMIHVFMCSQQLHHRVLNRRITPDGVESDHTAVRLDLMMTSLKHKATTTLTRGTIDWRKISSDQATNEHYNNILLETTAQQTSAISYKDFNELIIAAGTKAALLVKSTCNGWFQFSVRDLTPPIAE